MTCILGLVAGDGTCWMAGDRRAIANDVYIVPFGLPKIVRRGDVLLGVTGEVGHVNLLHHTDWPAPEVYKENGDYLFNTLLPFFREQSEKRWLTEMSPKGTYVNASLLYMRQGQLWRCPSMDSAELVSTGMHGVGSGYPEGLAALGVFQRFRRMTGSEHPHLHPADNLVGAMEVVARGNVSVGPPFDVLSDKGYVSS